MTATNEQRGVMSADARERVERLLKHIRSGIESQEPPADHCCPWRWGSEAAAIAIDRYFAGEEPVPQDTITQRGYGIIAPIVERLAARALQEGSGEK